MSALWLYRLLTQVGAPLIDGLLKRRLAQGKEDENRLPERRGLSEIARPEGTLIWIHAASVGESQSSLALIAALLKGRPHIHILQTTGTLTSAKLMSERLPSQCFHQFAPLDRMPWVCRFLDHWRPDMALWMESELWPNLVEETARRNIPAVLINARMSMRTFRRWKIFKGTARNLLGKFSLCLAQTEEQAECLRALGAPCVKYLGNLKFSAAPLPCDPSELERLQAAVGGRPVWLASSTHPGEEDLAATVHIGLKRTMPDLLTIIVPRHPSRGQEIAEDLRTRGLRVTRRSDGSLPDGEIYIADTLGELGLFYRLSGIAYIGGSMGSHGGHNPLEAAQLDCAIVYGPDMGNFKSVARDLAHAGGAIQIDSGQGLEASIASLLNDPARRECLALAAGRVASENADTVVRVHDEVSRLLNGG